MARPSTSLISPGFVWLIVDTGSTITSIGSTVAGSVVDYGTSAQFKKIQQVVAVGDSLFVADFQDHRIRRVNVNTQYAQYWVGDGTLNLYDGIGTSAGTPNPSSLTLHPSHGGILYFTHGNGISAIRRCRWNTFVPVVETIAGFFASSTASNIGNSSDGTMLTAVWNEAILLLPFRDKLLLLDRVGGNNTLIRVVDLTHRTISTLPISNINKGGWRGAVAISDSSIVLISSSQVYLLGGGPSDDICWHTPSVMPVPHTHRVAREVAQGFISTSTNQFLTASQVPGPLNQIALSKGGRMALSTLGGYTVVLFRDRVVQFTSSPKYLAFVGETLFGETGGGVTVSRIDTTPQVVAGTGTYGFLNNAIALNAMFKRITGFASTNQPRKLFISDCDSHSIRCFRSSDKRSLLCGGGSLALQAIRMEIAELPASPPLARWPWNRRRCSFTSLKII